MIEYLRILEIACQRATVYLNCVELNCEAYPPSCYTYFLDTLRLRQYCRQFPDDIFKCIFLNENMSILIKISQKFIPKGPINNIPALVQIMTWRRPCDKPLSEPTMV